MNFCLNKGDIFSGCKIISKCGEGAFGVTYYALNPIQQPVIIKVIPFSKSSERELKGLQNYMAVSGKHQNLLQIFHIGEFENGFYYIMEAADNCNSSGEYYPATLGNLFRCEHEFSPEKAIQIIRELLEGLKFMHNAGLIHRDIKPDNIIFVNNVPKLSEPGLVVKLGQTTSCAGTIGFIPPEVLNEESDMDHNADIYALGKVFYCMVTGLKPKQYPQLPMDMRVEVCRQIYPALSRMCNRNPDKRFKNADEFLAGLPVELEKPTYFETMRENLRNWYILNREKARLLLAAVATFFLLIIIAGAVLLTVYICRARKNAMYNNKVQRYLKINTDRKELLALQLQQFFPDAYDDFQKMSKRLNRIYPKNPEKSASITERLHILLGNCAKRSMPAFPDKKDDLSTNLTVLGQAYGFISSPLAMYLKPSELKSFKQKLADFEKGSYRNYSGPRCSSEYLNFNNPEMVMVFVPPGAVRLPHNKKIYKIPYHFWICKNEIISDDFTLKLGIAPQKNPRKGVPVERMTWNDLLFYCYLQTLKFKELNALPPGYIIRPLNEAEWQFAATNAWLGKDTDAPQKRIVAKETANSSHPSGYKNPNRLGIFDIYGNVSEIVQPVEPTKMQLSNVIRGGSFLNKLDKCETLRNEFLSYQNIPFDIGSRAALAPGDMDYFDRHFFLGGKTQCSVNGKIYELIGTNIGFFRWHTAEHLANLLGGRLAEFKTPQELKEVRKKMPLAGQWPTVVGGIKKGDKWVWLSDNTPVSFGKIRKSSPGKRGGHLALQGGTWVEKHHESMSIFICQWDADKFADRNKNLVKRAGQHLLKRFSYQGREFLLLSFPMSNYSAVRCAELLGGRLASLDSPELLALAKKELKAFENHRIRIGAYAKRDKWYWMSGRELTEKVLYSAKISRYKTETRNNNLAILYGGKIYDSASASAFLLELASPNLR